MTTTEIKVKKNENIDFLDRAHPTLCPIWIPASCVFLFTCE